MYILVFLSDNGPLSALLAPCREIKLHQKRPSWWLELLRKTRPWVCCPAMAIDLSAPSIYDKNNFAFSKFSRFPSSVFVSRDIISLKNIRLSRNGILKGVISPPLDLCVSSCMMACWCKRMCLCLHLRGGGCPLLSDTAHRRPSGLTAAHNDVMGAAAFASVVISRS